MKINDKIIICWKTSVLLGAYVPIRWTRLPAGLDGRLKYKMSARGIWGRVEINDDNGPEASLETALHETYHLKIKERAAKMMMDSEYIEAISALDQISPAIIDQYEAAFDAAPDPLRAAGEESIVWLAERSAAGLPMPPVSPALAATLADVTKPRPGRLISRLLTPLAALASLALLLSSAPASAVDMYEVEAGKTVRISEHRECRMVKNAGNNPIMVPTRAATEWSSGAGAFLNNIADMPGVSASACPPRFDDTCFFWASGIGGTRINDKSRNMARIADVSLGWTTSLGTGKGDGPAGSEMVGAGDYPDAYGSAAAPGPFYKSENGSFDTIAVGADTTVTFYAGKNFSGAVAFKVTGPKLIMNERWSRGPDGGADAYFRDSWLTENWAADPDPRVRQFTPATRQFISNVFIGMDGDSRGYPMHGLGRGSIRVECED